MNSSWCLLCPYPPAPLGFRLRQGVHSPHAGHAHLKCWWNPSTSPPQGSRQASIVPLALTLAAPRRGGQLPLPGQPPTIREMETQWNTAPVSGSSQTQFWGWGVEGVLYQFLRGSPGRVSPVTHSNNQWINTSLTGFFLLLPSLIPHSGIPGSHPKKATWTQDPSPSELLFCREPKLRQASGSGMKFCFSLT